MCDYAGTPGHGTTPPETLLALTDGDPDGKPTKPNDTDRARFKAHILNTYGRTVWHDYICPRWGRECEEWNVGHSVV